MTLYVRIFGLLCAVVATGNAIREQQKAQLSSDLARADSEVSNLTQSRAGAMNASSPTTSSDIGHGTSEACAVASSDDSAATEITQAEAAGAARAWNKLAVELAALRKFIAAAQPTAPAQGASGDVPAAKAAGDVPPPAATAVADEEAVLPGPRTSTARSSTSAASRRARAARPA
jgi:hypothetical protein